MKFFESTQCKKLVVTEVVFITGLTDIATLKTPRYYMAIYLLFCIETYPLDFFILPAVFRVAQATK